ncbi:unnamed protein product, partial [Nesidiocoris tenuis]
MATHFRNAVIELAASFCSRRQSRYLISSRVWRRLLLRKASATFSLSRRINGNRNSIIVKRSSSSRSIAQSQTCVPSIRLVFRNCRRLVKMMDGDVNQHLQEIQREYLDFLDDDEDQGIYHRRVRDMVESKRLRILVDLNDLRKKKPDRVKALKKNAAEEVFAFQNALKEYVHTVDPTYDHEEFFIGFEGSFGGHHVTPRTLVSSFLNSLVCLEGIVTQCSLNHPKLVRSVHYCPATQKMSERRYTDLTSLNPTSMNAPAYPTKDIDGNLLETEFGLCAYKDHQTLIIQEMPEKAPA